jgi:hypothetical protein
MCPCCCCPNLTSNYSYLRTTPMLPITSATCRALFSSPQGCKATICMPVNTPDIKVNNVRRLGGLVELVGESYQEAQTYAQVGGDNGLGGALFGGCGSIRGLKGSPTSAYNLCADNILHALSCLTWLHVRSQWAGCQLCTASSWLL